MSREKKKIYKSGDQINLRLSKSRVTQDVIDAINKANEEQKLNEFALTAFEFYVRYKENNNKYISVDEESKNKILKEYKLIEKSEIKEEKKVKTIKEYEKNEAEDEVFGSNKSKKIQEKGLKGAFASVRRIK